MAERKGPVILSHKRINPETVIKGLKDFKSVCHGPVAYLKVFPVSEDRGIRSRQCPRDGVGPQHPIVMITKSS